MPIDFHWDSGGSSYSNDSGQDTYRQYQGVTIQQTAPKAEQLPKVKADNQAWAKSAGDDAMLARRIQARQKAQEQAYKPAALDDNGYWTSNPSSYAGFTYTVDGGYDKKQKVNLSYTFTGEQADFIKKAYQSTMQDWYNDDDDDQWRKANGYVPRLYESNYTNSDADRFLLREGLPSLKYLPNYLNMARQADEEKADVERQQGYISNFYNSVATKLLEDYTLNGVRSGKNVYLDSLGNVVNEGTEGATSLSYSDYMARRFYDALDLDDTGIKRWYTSGKTSVKPAEKYDSEQEYRDALMTQWQKEYKASQAIESAQDTAIDKGQAGKDTNYTKSSYMFYSDPSFSYQNFVDMYEGQILPEYLQTKVLDDAVDVARVGGNTIEDLLGYQDYVTYLEGVAPNVGTKKDAVEWIDDAFYRYESTDNPYEILTDMRNAGATDAVMKSAKKRLKSKMGKEYDETLADQAILKGGVEVGLVDIPYTQAQASEQAIAEAEERYLQAEQARIDRINEINGILYDPNQPIDEETHLALLDELNTLTAQPATEHRVTERAQDDANLLVKNMIVDAYNNEATSSHKVVSVIGDMLGLVDSQDDNLVKQIRTRLLGENSTVNRVLDYTTALAGANAPGVLGGVNRVVDYAKGILNLAGTSASAKENWYSLIGEPIPSEVAEQSLDERKKLVQAGYQRIVEDEHLMSDWQYWQAVKHNGWGDTISSEDYARAYFAQTGQISAEEWGLLTPEQQLQRIDFFDKNKDMLPDVEKSDAEVFQNAFYRISVQGITDRMANDAVQFIDFAGTIAGLSDHTFADEINAGFTQRWSGGATNANMFGSLMDKASTAVAEVERMYLQNWMGHGIAQGIGKIPGFGSALTGAAGKSLKEVAGAGKVYTALAKTGMYLAQSSPFMASATASYFQEARQLGATDDQAVVYGAALGAMEGLVESFQTDEIWGKAFGSNKTAVSLFANRGNQAMTASILNRAKLLNLAASGLGEYTEESIGYGASWLMQTAMGLTEDPFSLAEMHENGMGGFWIGLLGSAISLPKIGAGDIMLQNANAVAQYIINNPSEANAAAMDLIASNAWTAQMSEKEREAYHAIGLKAIMSQKDYEGKMTNIRNNRRAIDRAMAIDDEIQAAETRMNETKKKYSTAKRLATLALNQSNSKTGDAKTEALAIYNKRMKELNSAKSDYNTAQARYNELNAEKSNTSASTIANAMASIARDANDIKAHHANLAFLFQEAGTYVKEMNDLRTSTLENAAKAPDSRYAIDAMLISGDIDTARYDALMDEKLNRMEQVQKYEESVNKAESAVQKVKEDMNSLRAGTYQQNQQAEQQQQETVTQAQTATAEQQVQQEQQTEAEQTAPAAQEQVQAQAQVQTQVQAETQAQLQEQAQENVAQQETTRRPITDEERAYTEDMGRKLGIKIVWDAKGVNGVVFNPATREMHLNPNVKNRAYESGDYLNSPAMITFKHELTHFLSGTKYWNDIVRFVKVYLHENGVSDATIKLYKANVKKSYEAQGAGDVYTDAVGTEELVADWGMNYLFRDQNMMNRFVQSNTQASARMLYKIQHFLTQANLQGKSRSYDLLIENIEYTFSKAFRQTGIRPSVGMEHVDSARFSAFNDMFETMFATERGQAALKNIPQSEIDSIKGEAMQWDMGEVNHALKLYVLALENQIKLAQKELADSHLLDGYIYDNAKAQVWTSFADDIRATTAANLNSAAEKIAMYINNDVDLAKEIDFEGKFAQHGLRTTTDVANTIQPGIIDEIEGAIVTADVFNDFYNNIQENGGELTDDSMMMFVDLLSQRGNSIFLLDLDVASEAYNDLIEANSRFSDKYAENRKAFLESNAVSMLNEEYLKKLDSDYAARRAEIPQDQWQDDPVLQSMIYEIANIRFAKSKCVDSDGGLLVRYIGRKNFHQSLDKGYLLRNGFFSGGAAVAADYTGNSEKYTPSKDLILGNENTGGGIFKTAVYMENPIILDCKNSYSWSDLGNLIDEDSEIFSHYRTGEYAELQPLPLADSPVAYVYDNKPTSPDVRAKRAKETNDAYAEGALGQYAETFKNRSGKDWYNGDIQDFWDIDLNTQLYAPRVEINLDQDGASVTVQALNKHNPDMAVDDVVAEWNVETGSNYQDAIDFIRQNFGDPAGIGVSNTHMMRKTIEKIEGVKKSSASLGRFASYLTANDDYYQVDFDFLLSNDGYWIPVMHYGSKYYKDGSMDDLGYLTSDSIKTDHITEMAEAAGYDGTIFKNLYDGAGTGFSPELTSGDFISTAAFRPEQMKSLAAVTYDDDGNPIPPSMRFNMLTPEMRMSADMETYNALFATDLKEPNAHDTSYIQAYATGDEAKMQSAISDEAWDASYRLGNKLLDDRHNPILYAKAQTENGSYVPVPAGISGARYVFARNPFYASNANETANVDGELSWTRDEYIKYAEQNGFDAVVYDDGTIDPIFDNGSVEVTAEPSTILPSTRFSVDTSDWDILNQRYGSIEPGMQPRDADIPTPRKVSDDLFTSKLIRSTIESRLPDDAARQTIVDTLGDEGFGVHARMTNNETISQANAAIIRAGSQTKALADLKQKIDSGRVLTNVEVATGLQLATNMAERGDMDSFINTIADLCIASTASGRSTQAWSLLKKTTGVGAAYYMQKVVDRLNKQYEKRIDSGRMQKIEIPPEMMQTLVNAKTGFEVEDAEAKITEYIGTQLPLSLKEALRNWRYFAMLANPTTHIRNIVGNAFMYEMVGAKNVVATGLETGLEKLGLMDKSERTHAIITPGWNRDAFDLAEMQWIEVGRDAAMHTSKFIPDELMNDAKKKSHFKWIDKSERVVGNALEREDEWFLHWNYRYAFQAYMKARGLDAATMTPAQISEANTIALEEANKATYHDASALATLINKMHRLKGIGWLAEGIMPFTKTPINIAKRSVEYSPIGFMKGIMDTVNAFSKGEITKAKAVDELSCGLTGSGLLVLGYALAKAGILRAKGEDDDKAETFMEQTGTQDYSVNIPNAPIFGRDISIDASFAAPASVPLFMGAALCEAMNGEFSLDDLFSVAGLTSFAKETEVVAANALDPLMEMSFLSSVDEALKQYGSSDNVGGNVGLVIKQMAKSYLGQFFPTFGAKIANIIDPYTRSGKGDITSPLGSDWDAWFRSSVVKKIPGATYKLEPSIDVHGDTQTQYEFGAWALEFANSWFLPGKITVENRNKWDNMLVDMYTQTGRTDIFPTLPSKKYVTHKGERYELDAKQFTQYQQDYAKDSYVAIKDAFNSSAYHNAKDDAERCDILSKALTESHTNTNKRWLEALGAYDND